MSGRIEKFHPGTLLIRGITGLLNRAEVSLKNIFREFGIPFPDITSHISHSTLLITSKDENEKKQILDLFESLNNRFQEVDTLKKGEIVINRFNFSYHSEKTKL